MAVSDRVRDLMLAPFSGKALPAGNGNGAKMATTGVSFVGAPDWRQIIQLGAGLDPDAEELSRGIALATSAYAYTAIMYRATRVGEPRLIVVEKTEDGDEEVEGHDLSMLLDEPSLDYDMGELQQLTEIYRCISGSALWVKEIDVAGRPARWVPFSGDEFSTGASEGRIYGAFRVETASGPRTYSAEEVVHFRDVNPNSWRKNLSKLDVALSLLDLGHQTARTVRRFMRKAMFPGGVISPDKDWNPSEEEWEAWKASILAWHQGPANAGDPLVLQGGTTFSKAALGLKDLLPDEMLDRIEATVSAVFGIPPVVLGWKVGLENSPWSQMSEARQMTYEDTIEPRWRDVERKMTRQILPVEEREAGRRIAFDTSEVRAFMADDKTKAEVSGAVSDIWTVNERRVYTGQDPLPDDDERGDKIGGTSEGMDGLASSLASAFGSSSNGNGSAGDPTPPTEGDVDEEGMRDAGRAALKAVEAIARGKGTPEEQKALSWLLFDASTKAAESTWTRILADALAEFGKDVVSIFDEFVEEVPEDGKSTKQGEPDPDSTTAFFAALGTFIADDAEGYFSRLTIPLVLSTGKTAVRSAAASVGLSFTVLEPGLAEYAIEEAEFLASVMGKSTAAEVTRIVQRELNSGTTVRNLRKALEESPLFGRKRAQLIARTETTRAWNGAQRRSLSTWERDVAPEGTRVVKEWLSAQDDRVRDEHAELDGTKIPIDEAFSNGLKEPGEPNCRCTLVYSIDGPKE